MREYRRTIPPVVKERIESAESLRFYIVSTSGPLAFLLKEESHGPHPRPSNEENGLEKHQSNANLGEHHRNRKNGMCDL
jgi:hypothetical protein